MRRLPALVPRSATSGSRAAPCCSGSSSQSLSLWPSWRAAEGDVAGASGGWVVAGAVVAGAGGEGGRSGERRVGEEGRSRWAPYHLKKKKDDVPGRTSHVRGEERTTMWERIESAG